MNKKEYKIPLCKTCKEEIDYGYNYCEECLEERAEELHLNPTEFFNAITGN